MKKEWVWTPISIIIAAFILGAFYFASEVGKQKPVEETQQAGQTVQSAQLTQQKKVGLYDCIAQVDNKWASIIAAAKGTPDASKYWNGITPEQQAELDSCYKQYQ